MINFKIVVAETEDISPWEMYFSPYYGGGGNQFMEYEIFIKLHNIKGCRILSISNEWNQYKLSIES